MLIFSITVRSIKYTSLNFLPSVPPGINAVRYAHSNSVPSNHHHSQSIVSNPALLVDAKPDPRRAFLSSHAHSIPASRPCSHSATPSPRTPQSLGHSSSVAAGVGAGKSSLSIPQMVSSLTHPNNIPVPLNFNAKELMAKMAASFSPQILETCMRIVSESFLHKHHCVLELKK